MTKPSATTSVFRSCSAAADAFARRLIVAGIHAYRRCLRDALARECLFSVSCSEHVLRAARDDGTQAAVRALMARVATCRGDYSVGSEDGQPFALTRDGVRLPFEVLTPEIQALLTQAHAEACASIAATPR